MDKYEGARIVVIDHPEYIYTVDMGALYPTAILNTNLLPNTEEEE